jgi:cyclic pyranopterin phosphate synthase
MTTNPRRPQLRIAVNSRCGRACFYCRPSGEGLATGAGLEIDPTDLAFFVAVAGELGLHDVKLTGGDPALYSGLVQAVGMMRSLAAVHSIEVISRHPAIAPIAQQLAAGGVDLFNMSIDTIDRELHRRITGVDDLEQLIAALGTLVSTGVPVKVNTVVMDGVNDLELPSLITFCERMGVASLKLLDVIDDLDAGREFNRVRLRRHGSVEHLRELYTPLEGVASHLASLATDVTTLRQGGLGHPMTVFTLASGLQIIVKDATAGAWYGPMCTPCLHYPCHDALMALRLTADLRLQFCLLREDVTVDVADLIRERDGVRLSAVLTTALTEYELAEFHTSTVTGVAIRGVIS